MNENTNIKNSNTITNTQKDPSKLSVGMHTLGCRLNLFESDGILSRFGGSDRFEVVPLEEGPDIAIVNTCTVTDQADSRNRNTIRNIIKKNPDARVVVTGCYAQTDAAKIAEIPGVSMVVGNDRKSALYEMIEEMLAGKEAALNLQDVNTLPVIRDPFAYGDTVPQGHTRAYVKIQDGCDRKCTYCKIPQARGRGISRDSSEIVEHIAMLEEKGIGEIVLTGVNLGWYREQGTDMRYNALVAKILDNLTTSRLRISSMEPCDVDAELAELSLHPRFCNFLHIPLQSGSREVLRLMRRTYNPFSFRKRVETWLKINPDTFLGTDVITGFPGETDEQFAETESLVKDLGFANIHPFRFSPRAGTVAADMKGRIHGDILRARMNRLLELKESGWAAYANRYLGAELEAVIEKNRQGERDALTDNFLRLHWEGESNLEKGEFRKFKLLEITENGRILARPV